jgi:hypothetical protein
MTTNNRLEWVRLQADLTADERAQMEANKGFLLPIDEQHVFDLAAWIKSPHKRKNRYPELDKIQQQALLDSIVANGVEKQVDINDLTFEVHDGNQRLTQLHKARSTNDSVIFRGFTLWPLNSEAECCDFEDRRAFLNRKPTQEQTREKIREAIRRHPDWADNRIAGLFQVAADTVTRVSKELEREENLTRPAKRLSSNGKLIDTSGYKKRKSNKTTNTFSTKNYSVALLTEEAQPELEKPIQDAEEKLSATKSSLKKKNTSTIKRKTKEVDKDNQKTIHQNELESDQEIVEKLLSHQDSPTLDLADKPIQEPSENKSIKKDWWTEESEYFPTEQQGTDNNVLLQEELNQLAQEEEPSASADSGFAAASNQDVCEDPTEETSKEFQQLVKIWWHRRQTLITVTEQVVDIFMTNLIYFNGRLAIDHRSYVQQNIDKWLQKHSATKTGNKILHYINVDGKYIYQIILEKYRELIP